MLAFQGTVLTSGNRARGQTEPFAASPQSSFRQRGVRHLFDQPACLCLLALSEDVGGALLGHHDRVLERGCRER